MKIWTAMHVKVLVFLILLLSGGPARAEQGCAPGFFPGGAQPGGPICVPIPGYGTTNNTTEPGGAAVWAHRWGAVAFGDGSDGIAVTGVAAGLPSRGKAKKVALNDCKSGGGQNCEVVVAYTNQCITVATGSDHTSYASAASLREAEGIAMSKCTRGASGTCSVLYQACSLPEQVR